MDAVRGGEMCGCGADGRSRRMQTNSYVVDSDPQLCGVGFIAGPVARDIVRCRGGLLRSILSLLSIDVIDV